MDGKVANQTNGGESIDPDALATSIKTAVEAAQQGASNSTVSIAEDVLADDNYRFILVPLAVLFAILVLAAMVYLMARNRRRLAHIYCKRKNLAKYAYEQDDDDDSEGALERNEDYDFDDPTECLLKGKLQIDNRYDSYRTTQQATPPGRNEFYA